MPTDRVLIEIVTAANMAGINQAKAGFLGMTPALMGLTVALGALVIVGKDAIANTEAMDKAHLGLAQAVAANNANLHAAITTHADTTKQVAALDAAERHLQEAEVGLSAKRHVSQLDLMHLADAHAKVTTATNNLRIAEDKTTTTMATTTIGLGDLQAGFDSWTETNKRFIADQYNAETALANFVRTGLGAKDSMRALNDALDLSVIKGVSMTDAQQILTLAIAGNSKGLKSLGITTAEYNAIMKSGEPVAQKNAGLLDLIEGKVKKGREALTPLERAQNALNIDWQNLTTKIGPPLINDVLVPIVSNFDQLLTSLDGLSKDKGWNDAISTGLGVIQNEIVAATVAMQLLDWWINNGGTSNQPGQVPATIGKYPGSLPTADRGPSSGTSSAPPDYSAAAHNRGAGVAPTVHTTMNVTIKTDPLNGQTADAISKALLMHARARPGL